MTRDSLGTRRNSKTRFSEKYQTEKVAVKFLNCLTLEQDLEFGVTIIKLSAVVTKKNVICIIRILMIKEIKLKCPFQEVETPAPHSR